jgi:dTDP-4-amino-4,6-dideoxygalactose transaminase
MIPLVSPIVGKQEKDILGKIIDTRILASGSYVQEFEKVCTDYFGTRYAVAASNGTTALHTALLACGIGPGDKVLTTPLTFIASSNSILYCGATPVFADIDPGTFNLSPQAAEKTLKKVKGIKAILLVHLYGMPADMDAFRKLQKKYKLALIEDCAQAHGARYKGKIVGSFGNAAAFSYYATKNVMMGEGGLVLTNSRKTDTLARQIINHGRSGHSTHTVLGYNYRLTNLAAGIGIVQMQQLDLWNSARRENARYLSENLRDLPFLKVPVVPENAEPVFHQYTLRITPRHRERFMAHLKENGVGCGIYYPLVIYRQPLYRKLGLTKVSCPQAERATREVVSIPVHPTLSKQDLAHIVKAIRGFKAE